MNEQEKISLVAKGIGFPALYEIIYLVFEVFCGFIAYF